MLREGKHWYVSFCVDNGVVEVGLNGLSAIGVDRGVAVPVATSDDQLTTMHGLVVLEDLRVKNMTASARGTIAQPGRNVRQKAGLNRAILDKSWGRMRQTIEWHGRKNGCKVVLVPPAFTSQTCSNCRHMAAESRESQARFRCVACGFECHADINAARVILALGLRATGRGELADGPPMKRQPPGKEGAHARAHAAA
jgi:putative transposase